VDEQLERELKFDVPDGWVLPDTGELTPRGGSIHSQAVRLNSTYFDTTDHDLLRSGVTLRRRTGDADTGWHLKVPAGDARTEIRLPVDGDTVPDELLQLVRGLTGGARVAPVATLETERHLHRVIDSVGSPLAEIADDEVTATVDGDTGGVSHWHEIEVELAEGDEKLLSRSARWLTRSGARPASVGSKLARAIGPVSAARTGERTLGELVEQYLREQHRVIVQGDVDLRRGGDVVHRTRVATRRFRSVLRVFGELFDADRGRTLDRELAWYAERLGAVRDVQVLREHLREQVAALPSMAKSEQLGAHLGRALDVDEQQAKGALLAALAGDRYAALLHDIRAFVEDEPARITRPRSDVAAFVKTAVTKQRKRLRAAAATPVHDDAMHRARKAAKRARYTAEVAEPVLGKRAARLVKLGKTVQNDLGTLQDAVVASHYLLGIAQGDGDIAFGLGVLWCAEQQRAADARLAGRKLARRV
jgi:CHAD domain-containing protein